MSILAGIVLGLVAGGLFGTIGMAGVSGLNPYSPMVAVLGAVVLLVVYQTVRRRQ